MKTQNKNFTVLVKWTGLLAIGLLLISNQAAADGNWLKLANTAPDSVSFMLLLSDGTVMAANNPDDITGDFGKTWYRLTPDPNGHYVNGEWSSRASMTYARHAFASQVLTNGLVFIAGGEHPPGGAGEASAEIYNPLNDTWRLVNPPASMMDGTQVSPGFSPKTQGFLDAASRLLWDGTVLLAPAHPNVNNGTLIYDPGANAWSQGTPSLNWQGEVSWVGLPDGSIISIDPLDGYLGEPGTNTERYIPALKKWIPDAHVPVNLWAKMGPPLVGEIGPAFMLPNGKAFFLGGSGATAIYTPSGATNAGSWVAGPNIPNGLSAADAPAAMMPNGKILCAVAGVPSGDSSGNATFPTPTSFFEYDYAAGPVGTFTQVSGPTGLTDDIRPQDANMLVLPDGSVLYCHSEQNNLFYSAFGSQLYVYVPIGSQVAAGAPSISGITPGSGGSFHLTGYNLNGISDGAAFGDESQMATDYPIIQFQDPINGHVDYGRTFNWTAGGGAYGAGSVDFTLPAGLIPQTYLVSISANGITSAPVKFSFVQPAFVAICPGESTTLSLITPPDPTLNYQWGFNGHTLLGATNAQLNLVSAQTNQSGYYNLGWIHGNDIISSPLVPVAVGVWVVSQPPANNSASICQPCSMSVHARGKGTLTAHWFRNSNEVVADSRISLTSQPGDPGETVFSINISETRYEDDATYTVLINDDCDQGSTSAFVLRVVPNPPWVQIATAGPPPRHAAAMCYDSDRKVTVMFGGGTWSPGAAGFLGDTWEFDGTNWMQRWPANSPVARSQANMVYDSKRHRTVLFGGLHYSATYGSQFSPETWEWDGANWQQIMTPHLPPWTETLYTYASCYDSVRGEMLLFGYLHDPLWSYDGTDWRAKNIGGSGPQFSTGISAMAFDSNRGVAVMPLPSGYGLTVWEWDGTAWQSPPQSGQQPRFTSAGPVLCYDTFRQECILFGSVVGMVDGQQTTDLYPNPDSFRCIWRWNGKEWQADPPTPTVGVPIELYHAMCFDSARKALVLFGGQGLGQFDVTNYTYEIIYQDDPAVLKQPTIQVYLQGQTVQLSVVAAGAPPMGYQWQKGVVNLIDGGRISGSTSNVLTINAANITDSGYYQVAVNNVCGMAVSQPIMLNVTSIPGTLAIGASGGNGGNMVITWSDSSVMLQTATNPTGPWTTLTGASSPFQVSQTGPEQFFRLLYP